MMAYLFKVKQIWKKKALYNEAFRINLILGLILLVALFIFTSFYFSYIECLPRGTVLDDWVLRRLPARDVSTLIVLFEASVFILLLARVSTNPVMFITFLFSSVLIYATRDLTIGITQLRAPVGLIELKDPIAGMVYRYGFVTRDLFYSGHIAFVFLIFLCDNNKIDRYYTLLACILIGFLLLVQHVHYMIDILAAPFFSFVCFWITKRIFRLQRIDPTEI
jgi:hypothetical protein